MADLQPALDYLAVNEGGYTVDDGGPTNWGVTAATAASVIGYTGSMTAFTYQQATQVYQQGFWGPMNLSALTSQAVANAIFDQAVNWGVGGVGAIVQAALDDPSIAWGGTDDGQWGPATLAAVNASDPNTFLVAFSAAALAAYQVLAQSTPSDQVYLNGWTNRANRILTLQSGVAGIAATVTQNPGATIGIGTAILLAFAFIVWGGTK